MVTAYSSPANRESPGKPDLVILGATILLVMVGLIMVYSAKLYVDQNYLAEQAKRIAIGVGLGVLGYFFPISWWGWRRFGWWVLILTIGALVLVRLFGVKHGGAARTWHGIQPSEFAKLAIAIFLAWYFQRLSQLREPERNFWRFLVRPLLFCAPVLALIIVQPAVSMALVVAVLILSLLYLAEVKLRYLFALGLVSTVLFGAVMAKFSHTQRRSEALVWHGCPPVQRPVRTGSAGTEVQVDSLAATPILDCHRLGRHRGQGAGQRQAEVPFPAQSPHRLYLRPDWRRVGTVRQPVDFRIVPHLPLARDIPDPARRRPVQPPVDRRHRADGGLHCTHSSGRDIETPAANRADAAVRVLRRLGAGSEPVRHRAAAAVVPAY